MRSYSRVLVVILWRKRRSARVRFLSAGEGRHCASRRGRVSDSESVIKRIHDFVSTSTFSLKLVWKRRYFLGLRRLSYTIGHLWNRPQQISWRTTLACSLTVCDCGLWLYVGSGRPDSDFCPHGKSATVPADVMGYQIGSHSTSSKCASEVVLFVKRTFDPQNRFE